MGKNCFSRFVSIGNCLKKPEESAGVTEVSLDVVNDFDGSLMGDISFSLTTSDNPYEYTLNADSVQYNEH